MNITSRLPLCKWSKPPAEKSVPAFAARLGFDAVAWTVAASRFPEETADEEIFDRLLSPKLSSLAHPMSFPGIREAAAMISRTIDSGGEIVVFGDFDADGIVSTAILAKTIRAEGGKLRTFIPLRKEGYGLTDAAVERCLSDGLPDLFITVDCGITSAKVMQRLQSLGVETIVTDHHIPGGEALPEQTIVCATCRDGVPSGCRSLCGAGIAFELAAGLTTTRHPEKDQDGIAARRRLFESLDALAIATIADIVPLSGENRTLVSLGLKRMNSSPSPGIKQLLLATMDCAANAIDARAIAFILGPHVNSAGRMADARIALELFLTEDADDARAVAARLKQTNAMRKSECARVDTEIERTIGEGGVFDPEHDGAAIVSGEDWPAGVIGLAAAHLSERFSRPAIAISFDGGDIGRGSVRAPEGYDVHAALPACSGLLEGFGGHESAAGLTISRRKLDAFKKAFGEACIAQVGAPCVVPALTIDAAIDIGQASLELADSIAKLAPFGAGNAEPVFQLDGVSASASLLGRDATKGLRLSISDGAGRSIDGLWFGAAGFLGEFRSHSKWSIAATLLVDDYFGARTLKLKVVDAKPLD